MYTAICKKTPKVYLIRHSETEWSKSGQFTSSTDLCLTPNGVEKITKLGENLHSIIDFERIKYIFSSPRKRAKDTKDLIFNKEDLKHCNFIIDDDLKEWEYGQYEGLLTKQILALRKEQGFGDSWNIWNEGCKNEFNPLGETTEEIGFRLWKFIKKIQNIQQKGMETNEDCDIVIFAHGHCLRYLAALWFMGVNVVNKFENGLIDSAKNYLDDSYKIPELEPLNFYLHLVDNPWFMLDAGGVACLSYSHNNIKEPSLKLNLLEL
ncbi:phosphoglycerate mutase-like protein [Hanseniaspora valbyensis NRRL Y-1626]|uniref:Phosphoglycerate mutase-like protein n=1 Tax=Hanseniaspora valbyensis NRRL Y-1626 TaxID=766949 RepID=A0A1B7TI60_9ASCO|nr:phosphoglycerate mutase-like protein [Hanseniaspora valbyensis NRRL Y-1626]